MTIPKIYPTIPYSKAYSFPEFHENHSTTLTVDNLISVMLMLVLVLKDAQGLIVSPCPCM